MTDFLNEPLAIGDEVVFREPNGRNADYLRKGEIVGFTPKMVRVQYANSTRTKLSSASDMVKVRNDLKQQVSDLTQRLMETQGDLHMGDEYFEEWAEETKL